jgi:hypothetical protein
MKELVRIVYFKKGETVEKGISVLSVEDLGERGGLLKVRWRVDHQGRSFLHMAKGKRKRIFLG